MSTKRYDLARTGWILAAVAAAAVTFPSVAAAEQVWDIEEYDSCTRMLHGIDGSESEPIAQEEENQKWCCFKSGGLWSAASDVCVAPPAESAGSPSTPIGPIRDLPTVRVEQILDEPVVEADRPALRPALG
ncbi:hypothetical protein H7J88_25775 [Mycolicibacterium flavescens]|uniref:Secreted protein n=1 Tax=Mycolicibacterium flavescens TaxID=1776 RepID=A0A1E3RDH5_MYCFV|nr:hypothetical protein [Mycolicibacterium flavescens]MCV7283049.1 hypothetical protein [Mycolicibacterium flavescens]ODQ87522.1 hypothetical protein BHQ18_23210 [Mycolicibacterium flavescens]